MISGFGDGTFAPESLLTKEQLAVILYKYAKTLGTDIRKRLRYQLPRPALGQRKLLMPCLAPRSLIHRTSFSQVPLPGARLRQLSES
ncbi:MAG: hypothetical protein LBT59_11060 [Clostridiales bacterium]|nr:hypothetical protein [Clostridiales bacterium]